MLKKLIIASIFALSGLATLSSYGMATVAWVYNNAPYGIYLKGDRTAIPAHSDRNYSEWYYFPADRDLHLYQDRTHKVLGYVRDTGQPCKNGKGYYFEGHNAISDTVTKKCVITTDGIFNIYTVYIEYSPEKIDFKFAI